MKVCDTMKCTRIIIAWVMFVTTYVQLIKLGKHDEYELCIEKSPCVVSPVRKRMSEYHLGFGRPIDKLLINNTGKHLLEKWKLFISCNGTLYVRIPIITHIWYHNLLFIGERMFDITGCTICRNNIDPDSQRTNTTTKFSPSFEVKILSNINALYSINRVQFGRTLIVNLQLWSRK